MQTRLAILVGIAAALLFEPPPKRWAVVPRTGLGSFDVYVINMDRAPERLRHFAEQLRRSDFRSDSVIRVSATDGTAMTNDEVFGMLRPRARREMAHAEATGFRSRHYQVSRGAVGCYASHLRLWKSILETDKQVAVVFEDDAQLEPHLYRYLRTTPFPHDFDIVLLGYVCVKCSRDEGAGFHRVKRFFGLHGYVISTRGIQKIMASPRAWPIAKQIDAMLSDMASAGELVVYANPRKMVEQANEVFETSIQIPMASGIDEAEAWAPTAPHK